MELSTWAKKFGTHETWQNKSGFTPIRPQLPSIAADSKTQDSRAIPNEVIEQYQRDQLYDFTTQELVDLDVVSSRKLKASNLGGEIIPFLRQNRWYDGNRVAGETVRTYPFREDPKQRWLGINPNVWKILKPSLLIATRMFTSPGVQVFIDMLIAGERQSVDPSRIPPWTSERPDSEFKNELPTLHPLPLSQRRLEEKQDLRDSIYSILEAWWMLGFKNERQDPVTLDKKLHITGIWTFFDYEYIEPLLNEDLDDSVRFGLQYWIATTIVHESMHAIWHVLSMEKSALRAGVYEPARFEPFIENETISEIGFSMESRAIGGLLHPMRKNKPFPSFGYWCDPDFPTTNDIQKRFAGSAVLKIPPLSPTITSFPVQLSVFEDVHSREFWEFAVKRFPTPILHFRQPPIKIVSTWKLTDDVTYLSRQETDRLPLVPDLDDFIYNAMEMSPEDREVLREPYDMAHRMIESCKLIKNYWKSSNELNTSVAEINLRQSAASNLKNTIRNKKEDLFRRHKALHEWIALLEEQIVHLEKAVIAHRGRIDVLPALEAQIISPYPGRREVLCNFNKETRVFAREIRKRLARAGLSQQAKQRLDKIDLHLEISRMRLYNPEDPNFGDTDAGQEISIISDAKRAEEAREFEILRNGCKTYLKLNDPSQSLFFRAVLLSYFAMAPIEPGEDFKELRKSVEGHELVVRTLRDLTDPDQCPESWKNLLIEGAEVARRALIIIEHQMAVN